MRYKKTTSPKRKDPQDPAVKRSSQSVPEYFSESWTEREDALEILAKCAALIRTAEVACAELIGARSPEWLAGEAAKIINACELQLKKESLQSAHRIKEQARELRQSLRIPSPMCFEQGLKALVKLGDTRPERMEKFLLKLIGKDFDSRPRSPRHLDEHRKLSVEGPSTRPSRDTFVKGEMEWYRARGFSKEDITHLESLRDEGS